MIDVVHRELSLRQDQLTKDVLKHAALGMDGFAQFVRVKGQYEGLQIALEIVENLMGERVDRDH